jgi:hypothetical protein
MMRTLTRPAAALLLFAALGARADITSTVIDVPVQGTTMRILDVRPQNPVATLVVISGGQGYLDIRDDGSMPTTEGKCGPVARNRVAVAERGYAVALVNDAVTASVAHTQSLIDYLQARSSGSVWLVGGSSSSTEVAALANALPSSLPLGLIVFSPTPVPTGIANAIHRPTLVVNHAFDSAAEGTALYAALTATSAKAHDVLTGGGGTACSGYHTFYGIDDAFVGALSSFIDRYDGFLVSPPAMDLTQHGLTGSWYEPATSGQGVEVEVFPGIGGAGKALYQLSWFTYDAIAGGADRQRWYTASGTASTGASSVALTVYANSGGNFDAPPATTPLAAGTATLAFDSCTSGHLEYAFTSGASGIIPLTRLTRNVTCVTSGTPATDADFALSGNWYDPATSGQGVTLEVNPVSGALFLAWYTYALNGANAGAAGQRWYTAQSAFVPGARSMPVTIYETTGGVFDSTVVTSTVVVGTGTLAFHDCSEASLAFTFTGGSSAGRSGAIALGRVGPVPPGCV